MAWGTHGGSIDRQRLSRYLAALAVPNRLELLRQLQVPRTAHELRLSPARHDAVRRDDRPLTKRAVELHLAKLRELGLVRARAAVREGRAVTEYVVNQARLFAVLEELRMTSLIRAAPSAATEGTDDAPADGAEDPAPPEGPALVLVSGPLEGKVLPLRGPGPWVVGRARQCEVPLAYDPFVSKQNARLRRDEQGFWVESLPRARNGTRVNWRLLAPGELRRLVPGDNLGVGRSVLTFRGG